MLEGLKLGIIQGLTEFLPVSSSGHLVLFSKGGMTTFTEIIFHAATLLAVLIVFRKEAAAVFLSPFRAPRLLREGGLRGFFLDPQVRLLWIIAIATLPAAVAGLLSHDLLDQLLASPAAKTWVAIGLCTTGAFLFSSRFFHREYVTPLERITILQALAIGLFQAAAILPGLSRSGLTIVAALLFGLSRPAAGTFSFLLAIPIISGATLYQVLKVARAGSASFIPSFHISGSIAAFLTGLLALIVLLKIVKNGKLHHFAWYGFALAALSLTLL